MEEVEHIAGPIHPMYKQVALQDEVEDSTASSSDKLLAGLSQSQKRTCDECLTVKKPLENIDEEVRIDTLLDLSEEIQNEQKNLGRKLGLDESKLYQLERDYINQGHKETVYQMLLTWKRRIGSQATHRVLGEALKAVGRRDLQEKLYVQAMKQHKNYRTSTPRAAIHPEENEDTLDYERNENNNNGDDDNYNDSDSDTYNADTLHYDTKMIENISNM
ncbi:putative receptor-interacting serine/threonine-protein kinase 1-like [Apostichopus japonicus]|uniref:Putative receptor-interacting serine/threonine-protein kinase 1-like n=1 Tax=Stichopus japonicus TaxID=307972 RepID=A0A2G8JI75_STIJA|nr:putative receptor-interacting serine/threonine-protein kinase 1-like [Apostichopus japonicus]